MNIFQKIGRGIVGLFVRAGLTTVKFIAAILLGVVKGLSFLLSELLEMVQSVGGRSRIPSAAESRSPTN